MLSKIIHPRQRVLDHFGGCCARCGESDPDKLCIDHIHGGGSRWRRLTKESSNDKYERILREIASGEPLDYQILCLNDNAQKARMEQKRAIQEKQERKKAGSKQIWPKVSAHTYEELIKDTERWKLTQGEVIDRWRLVYESKENVPIQKPFVSAAPDVLHADTARGIKPHDEAVDQPSSDVQDWLDSVRDVVMPPPEPAPVRRASWLKRLIYDT